MSAASRRYRVGWAPSSAQLALIDRLRNERGFPALTPIELEKWDVTGASEEIEALMGLRPAWRRKPGEVVTVARGRHVVDGVTYSVGRHEYGAYVFVRRADRQPLSFVDSILVAAKIRNRSREMVYDSLVA